VIWVVNVTPACSWINLIVQQWVIFKIGIMSECQIGFVENVENDDVGLLLYMRLVITT